MLFFLLFFLCCNDGHFFLQWPNAILLKLKLLLQYRQLERVMERHYHVDHIHLSYYALLLAAIRIVGTSWEQDTNLNVGLGGWSRT